MERMERRALLICDMWNHHWCRSLEDGTDALAPRLAKTVAAFREVGGTIVHAPSETMRFYTDYPARIWVTDLSKPPLPANLEHPDPPLPQPQPPQCPEQPPCDQPDGPPWPWTCQHPAISVAEPDAILETGCELLAVIHAREIELVYVTGVHTNMCVLDRSFGIKQLRRWGIECRLVSDLTEAAPPTYTDDVVKYIDTNWCRAVTSDAL
jgi:nicotinamidase-related amidase